MPLITKLSVRIFVLLVLVSGGLTAQIRIETPIFPETRRPLDYREQMATLSDTSVIQLPYDRLTAWVVDIRQYWMYDATIPAWVPLEQAEGAQVISLSGDTLYLSNGGAVYIGYLLDNTDNQAISITGNVITLERGGTIQLPSYTDPDADPLNEIQVISRNGRRVSLSKGGGFFDLPLDPDEDPENELQDLSISNDTLFISGRGFVVLPTGGGTGPENPSPEDSDHQRLSISGRQLSLERGGTVTLPAEVDGDVTNEIQLITLEGDILTLSDGGTVDLSKYRDVLIDTDDQTLSYNPVTNQLTIEDGNTVDLNTYVDPDDDPTNELQKLTRVGDNAVLNRNGGTISLNDNDANPLNEIQELQYDPNTGRLTLTLGGGTVDIPLFEPECTGVTAYSYEDAAAQGVSEVGECFIAAFPNTMGATPGTKVVRQYSE